MTDSSVSSVLSAATAAMVAADGDVADELATLLAGAREVLAAEAVAALVRFEGSVELLSATSHRPADLRIHEAQTSEGPCVEAIESGADVAFGSLPLHPSSPATLLSDAVGRWAEQAAAALASQAHPITGDQFFTGQLAVRRDVFEALGGFATRFAADGGYGIEDLDFGYRVVEKGCHVAFNPAAISRQYYAVPAAANFEQYRKMGHADVAISVDELSYDGVHDASSLASSRMTS